MILVTVAKIVRCRDDVVVRAVASQQRGTGSISRLGVLCGLILLVLYSALGGCSSGTPGLPSPHKPTYDLN